MRVKIRSAGRWPCTRIGGELEALLAVVETIRTPSTEIPSSGNLIVHTQKSHKLFNIVIVCEQHRWTNNIIVQHCFNIVQTWWQALTNTVRFYVQYYVHESKRIRGFNWKVKKKIFNFKLTFNWVILYVINLLQFAKSSCSKLSNFVTISFFCSTIRERAWVVYEQIVNETQPLAVAHWQRGRLVWWF